LTISVKKAKLAAKSNIAHTEQSKSSRENDLEDSENEDPESEDLNDDDENHEQIAELMADEHTDEIMATLNQPTSGSSH
jgi:hypothetical protein